MKILHITDEKWKLLCGFFSCSKRGRPQKWDDRCILEALVYLMHTGCQWRRLPREFPPYSTVYRRFKAWVDQGLWAAVLETLLEVCFSGKQQEVSVSYIDATFVRALGGGDNVGRTKLGKGSKIMAIVDKNSRPLAALVASAAPHEITLVKDTLAEVPAALQIKRLVGDKAYDSDAHDKELAASGIELIAPNRQNRTRGKPQDKRKLRRYSHRWVVERFFAWMKPARRLLTRFDKKTSVFQAFLDLFAALTLIKDC